MARKPRIEYEGAVYHVMSRGNRGADIFVNDRDRRLFIETLEEATERTAWEIHAFVLMRNHYHFLLETPNANLVDGMKWFQGAFTQRMNARHKWRGHLFQGRYKAQNIDEESADGYFLTVADYIHLNPARAGMIGRVQSNWKTLRAYPWSSFPLYLEPKRKRPEWLHTEDVLAESHCKDDAHGRRRYGDYLEKRVLAESRPGREEAEAVKGGWFLGGERFRDRLLDRIEEITADSEKESIRGEGVREVGERRALELMKEGMRILGLNRQQLGRLRKTDLRKQAVAWHIRSRTTVSTRWIADQMSMGDPSSVSRAAGVFRGSERGDGEVWDLKRKLMKNSGFRD